MKRLFIALPMTLAALLMACGDGADGDNANGDGENDGTDGNGTASMYADVIELAAKSELNTVEFNRVANFMEEQEVILTGYPYAYPIGIGEEVKFIPNRTEMIDGTDNSLKNCSIRINFKDEKDTVTMKIGDLFAVKGKLKISHSSTGTRITLEEAVFVDGAKDKGGTTKSIADIDPTKEIFCGDLHSLLHEHYIGLAKKKMTISGNYISTTVSESLDGEILEIRVDIGDSDNKVGCEMIEEPDGDLLNGMRSDGKALKIQGSFSGMVFGNPRISECVLK